MKKINAVLGWLAMIVLLAHLGTMTYSFLTGWYDLGICKTLARVTAAIVCGHAVVSLVIVMILHDRKGLGGYPRLNARTYVQRVSAIAILVLLVAHVHSYGFIASDQPLDVFAKAFVVLTELLFFAAISAHLAVSFPKSLVTWGLIRQDRTEARLNRASAIVCALLFAIPGAALVRFVVMWPAV